MQQAVVGAVDGRLHEHRAVDAHRVVQRLHRLEGRSPAAAGRARSDCRPDRPWRRRTHADACRRNSSAGVRASSCLSLAEWAGAAYCSVMLASLDDRAPFGALAVEMRLKRFGRAAERRDAELAKLLLPPLAFEVCVHERADLVDDLARRSGRREQRVPSARLETRKARFVHGRNIRQVAHALEAGHRKPADRALLHGRHEGRDVVEADLQIAGDQVGQRLGGDAIRHVNDRGAGQLVDQFKRDVRLRSVTDRAGIELARDCSSRRRPAPSGSSPESSGCRR